MIRRLAFTLALTTTFAVSTEAQTPRPDANRKSTDSRIEVKDDRFTGKRTVLMPSVRVAPDHEMSLTGEINTARKPDYMEMDLGVMVTAEFATPADSGVKFVSEMDFIFLVDGKRTMRAAAGTGIGSDVIRRDGRRTAIGILTQSTLERIAAGRKIEMKLGDTEAVLGEATLKSIRAFVAALQR